ncbi:MAG: hypothetical protein IJ769_12840, partial [Clostridia bacterium]|nr:hypothetical protein [Clostridia bacterium]
VIIIGGQRYSIADVKGLRLEKRMVDVVLRHGAFPGMAEKWRKWFDLKAYFEAKIGGSLYDLFPECAEYTFKR